MPPFRKSLLSLVTAAALAAVLPACGGDDDTVAVAPQTPATAAFAMTAHLAIDGIAEIVAATPDGLTLVYTSADAGAIGLVDLADPAAPKVLQKIDVRRDGVGEPTSVAITPDGRFAVVAVRLGDDVANATPGILRIYDLSNRNAVTLVKDIPVGIGPDSIALVGSGATLRAVVAIEDEETLANGDASIPGVRAGRIDVAGLQDLPGYGGTGTGLQSVDLVAAATAAGLPYPADPQPEFVSVRAGTSTAVVSLQENNGFAVVDLSDPKTAKLVGVYSSGVVTRTASADLKKDAEIAFTDSFTGRREADAVAWVTDTVFATANEGDTSVGADGVRPGARGFSLLDRTGAVVFDSGASTELRALQYGHYPDSRSASKGIEVEGLATATYGGTPFLFVGSERGGFVEVHRFDNGRTTPTFVQLLPTGMSPEGLATITARADGQQLFVTANEGDGSINVYRFFANGPAPKATEPQIAAKDTTMPWGALSGLTTDGTHLYAVPDNAFGQSRIWRLDMAEVAKGRVTIDKVIPLTLAGAKFNADPEGIAVVPDGFWVAVEGSTVAKNELVKVSPDGAVLQRVALSAAVQAKFANPNNSTGFEGVTASADGKTLYVALQRGFDIAQPYAAVLKYDVTAGTWASAQYPLQQHGKDPVTYWMGLSEIQLAADGRLLLLERDKGGGEGRAINAEFKRIYSVDAAAVVDGATLSKTLVRDLRKDFNWLHEKAEGMVVFQGDLWVVNDNDGGGWTRMLNTGKL